MSKLPREMTSCCGAEITLRHPAIMSDGNKHLLILTGKDDFDENFTIALTPADIEHLRQMLDGGP